MTATQIQAAHFAFTVLVPRMHEEIAGLRRLLGIYEDALEDIAEGCEEKARHIAHEALYVAKQSDHHDTAPDEEAA